MAAVCTTFHWQFG